MATIYAVFFCTAAHACLPVARDWTFANLQDCNAARVRVAAQDAGRFPNTTFVCMKAAVPAWSPAR